MIVEIGRRNFLGGLSMLALAGCTGIDLGRFGGSRLSPPPVAGTAPPVAGRRHGNGPVVAALLLPLSGSFSAVGTSMANGAQLAMEFIAGNTNIADNLTLVVKDVGSDAAGAAAGAQQAAAEGAAIILGPLTADQVSAAGGVARSAGLPVIGFSNNSGAAAPGIYLLNVLPETEVRRSLGYVKAAGRRAVVGVFPNSSFGRIQQGAFTQAAADLGVRVAAVFNFSTEAEARQVVDQLAPMIAAGQVDTLFLPDRATAPSFGVLFERASIAGGAVQIVGSADWAGDNTILSTPWLAGAIYPALDDAGYNALAPLYTQRFGAAPHPLATMAYTAVILANVSSLSLGSPRYDARLLTTAAGFNGRDGLFRLFADGRSEFALAVKQVGIGGTQVVDAPKL